MKKPADGELFQPSNGTEFSMFVEHYCDCCADEDELEWRNNEVPPGCKILSQAFYLRGQPEWVYKNGIPHCTKFTPLPRLGIDGKPLEPEDERQLKIEVE